MTQLNKSVANGDIKKGSDEWYEMCQQIDNVTNAIDESNKSLVEYKNQLRQIKWDNFDYLEERIGDITAETDFMINQLSRKDLTSDKIGDLTDEGKAVNALHISNMTAYKQQSYDYKHEIDKINAELAKDPYNTTLLKRKDELVQKYQECIDKANEEKFAVISLIKQGYDALKNKISELTTEYTNLLDKEKSAYDYSQSIQEKTEKIAQIRKQIDAYNGDNSEETQATIQKLQVSLKDSEKDLKDSQYDKFISDTKDILSDLQDNLSDDIDNIIQNLDSDFDNLIKEYNKSSSENTKTITNAMKGMGYTSTDEITTILNSSNFVTGTKDILAEIKKFHKSMNKYIDDKETAETINNVLKIVGVEGDLSDILKKIGVPGYAKGSKGISRDQLALLAEKGTELQYDTSQGVLRPVGKGDMIFTNEMTKRLWDFAQKNPVNFATNLTPISTPLSNIKSNVSNGDINIDLGGIIMNGVNDPETFGKQLRDEICKNGKTTQCITEAVSSKQLGAGIGKARLYR